MKVIRYYEELGVIVVQIQGKLKTFRGCGSDLETFINAYDDFKTATKEVEE